MELGDSKSELSTVLKVSQSVYLRLCLHQETKSPLIGLLVFSLHWV